MRTGIHPDIPLSREERLEAAAEIRLMDGQWGRVQVKAPFRRKLPRGVDRAVAALLAEYQGIQDRTPGRERRALLQKSAQFRIFGAHPGRPAGGASLRTPEDEGWLSPGSTGDLEFSKDW